MFPELASAATLSAGTAGRQGSSAPVSASKAARPPRVGPPVPRNEPPTRRWPLCKESAPRCRRRGPGRGPGGSAAPGGCRRHRHARRPPTVAWPATKRFGLAEGDRRGALDDGHAGQRPGREAELPHADAGDVGAAHEEEGVRGAGRHPDDGAVDRGLPDERTGCRIELFEIDRVGRSRDLAADEQPAAGERERGRAAVLAVGLRPGPAPQHGAAALVVGGDAVVAVERREEPAVHRRRARSPRRHASRPCAPATDRRSAAGRRSPDRERSEPAGTTGLHTAAGCRRHRAGRRPGRALAPARAAAGRTPCRASRRPIGARARTTDASDARERAPDVPPAGAVRDRRLHRAAGDLGRDRLLLPARRGDDHRRTRRDSEPGHASDVDGVPHAEDRPVSDDDVSARDGRRRRRRQVSCRGRARAGGQAADRQQPAPASMSKTSSWASRLAPRVPPRSGRSHPGKLRIGAAGNGQLRGGAEDRRARRLFDPPAGSTVTATTACCGTRAPETHGRARSAREEARGPRRASGRDHPGLVGLPAAAPQRGRRRAASPSGSTRS